MFHVAIVNYWVDYILEFIFYFCLRIENHGLTWEIFTLLAWFPYLVQNERLLQQIVLH